MLWKLGADDRTPEPIYDTRGLKDGDTRRHVAFTEVFNHLTGTRLRVSTVFIGVDHNFERCGAPIVFETMVFPEDSYGEMYCERYCTWEEAEAGHKVAVEWAWKELWKETTDGQESTR